METVTKRPALSASAAEPCKTGCGSTDSATSSQLLNPVERELSATFLDGMSLKQRLEEVEIAIILTALKRTQGNKAEAAKLMGMGRTCLSEKCRRYGIDRGDFGTSIQ